jgi:predicted amidohydrolase
METTIGVVADEKHWGLAQRAHDEAAVEAHDHTVHWLESFRTLAMELQIDIAVGTIVEKGEVKDGKQLLHNVAHYVSKEGKILGKYTKENLWWPERDYLTRGEDGNQPVFETAYGRCGFLICWDLAYGQAWQSVSSINS